MLYSNRSRSPYEDGTKPETVHSVRSVRPRGLVGRRPLTDDCP
jgi:hypothetical protein